MADYQEYRRRILHRRWRRVFIIVALLALLALLSAIGILWKVLHRERVDTALSQNTILRQVTTDNTWNTVSYPLARQLCQHRSGRHRGRRVEQHRCYQR